MQISKVGGDVNQPHFTSRVISHHFWRGFPFPPPPLFVEIGGHGTLVNGNMDKQLRSPCGLIFTQSHVICFHKGP